MKAGVIRSIQEKGLKIESCGLISTPEDNTPEDPMPEDPAPEDPAPEEPTPEDLMISSRWSGRGFSNPAKETSAANNTNHVQFFSGWRWRHANH